MAGSTGFAGHFLIVLLGLGGLRELDDTDESASPVENLNSDVTAVGDF
jgi:hypothetical protein